MNFREAVPIEVPNPRHPSGARGVGEVSIVPPMAAIANAVRDASGLRMPDLPISPPKLLAATDAPLPAAAEDRYCRPRT
jgi:CO/xanthine dehydrogenase Mo-binding subunit